MENYTRIMPPMVGSSENVLDSLCTDFDFDKKSLAKFLTTLNKYDYEPKNRTLLTGTSFTVFNTVVNEFGVEARQFANFLREVNANYDNCDRIPPLSPNTNIVIASLSDSFKIRPGSVVNFLDTIKNY